LSRARAPEAHFGHRRAEHAHSLLVQLAKLPDLAVAHVGVVADGRAAEPIRLASPGGHHLGAHLGAGGARRATGKLAEGDGGDFDVDVDAVHQRPADLRHVLLDLLKYLKTLSLVDRVFSLTDLEVPV
jgi:hypothetical protein